MVNLLYTQTKDGFVIAIDTDRIQSAMASGEGDSMAPDEMYLMLQADMLSIKQQEQVLHSEIEDIASKFHELLESCGIDSDTGSGIMAPPSTPSFMKTNASLTQVTRLETFMRQTPSRISTYSGLSDSSSDEESRTMFPESEQILEGLVNKSDGLPQDVSSPSSKTLVVDRNSNYLDSPHNEVNDNHTPVIEALTSLDKTSTSDSNTTTSSSSSHRMSSSDGYPKSDESTDNQIVPECYDLDKEFMSRLQYYSDFTLDRQRKINCMVVNCGGALKDADNCEAAADILTRHVEGKESSPDKPMFVKPLAPPPSTTSSGSDYHSTPSSRRQHRDRAQRHRYSRSSRKPSSKPLASSTMLDTSFSSSSSGRGSHRGNTPLIPQASSTMIYESGGSSSGSNRRNKSNGSNPRACSTMLNESFLSSGSSGSGSRHRSTPMANSTMINALPPMVPCGAEPTMISVIRPASDNNGGHSDNDCESVYTWSIHDGDSGSDKDISLEESYMKKVTSSNKKANNKPPLPPSKRARSGSVSSSGSHGEHQCKDHQLHKLLGEPCSKTILASCSVIEPSDTCREEALYVESMCGDLTECTVPKSNTLPRSSTRVKLQDKSSGSSSLEARRASLPDLTSVGATYADDHSVPESFSDDDMTALSERPECQGKSSSSNDNPGNSQGSANVDSILTDSPNSVCSSGINAPCNSPGTNTSSSSRVSLSTTSDARSSDSNINTRAPQVILRPRISAPANSPKLQNVDKVEGAQGSTFKVPKQNQPLRNLFRFRRKSKTPEVKTSTPKPVLSAQPGSKRQLFPSAGTTNLQSETKVMDKKAVIRKFKKFSDSFRQRDRSGKPQIETLANL